MTLVRDRVERGPDPDAAPGSRHRSDRRRFVVAAAVATGVVAIPYSWVLLVLWNGGPSLLRTAYQPPYASNFYDLQARAIMSGHLYVPKGSLGVLEGWIYHGHTYTYFGVFPSLLRIPVFLFTHSLDGKLSAVSILLAWLLTAVLTSMLIWRIRVMVRGDAPMGRAETLTLGALVAAQLGGSVLVYLAANPYVFSEDKAWSVALSLGAILTLLGVLERPSWQRVIVCGLFVLATSLTRAVEGYAVIIGAVLVALWFAFSRAAEGQRRWWPPMLGVAAVALVAGAAVSWAKSGVLFGQALNEYEAFHVLHESRINGGSYFSPVYFPTDLWTYFGPTGLRVTGYFPFVSLSSGPPQALDGVPFDFLERTSSALTSMPLLVLLGFVGLVGVLRRRVVPAIAKLRLVLLAAGVGAAAVLVYGTLTERYVADLLPLLFAASAAGAVFLWSKLDGRPRRDRTLAATAIVVLAVFGVAANVGIALVPNVDWTQAQTARYVAAQQRVGNAIGMPLAGRTLRGDQLPVWAPADTLFVAGRCNALYISTGEHPAHEFLGGNLHENWLPVEYGAGYAHRMAATFGVPGPSSAAGFDLATIGATSVVLHSVADGANHVSVWTTLRDPEIRDDQQEDHAAARLDRSSLTAHRRLQGFSRADSRRHAADRSPDHRRWAAVGPQRYDARSGHRGPAPPRAPCVHAAVHGPVARALSARH